MHKTKINNYIPVLSFGLILLLYLFTLKGLPGNLHPNGIGKNSININQPPFETSMERGRYAQTVSLVESKNLDVNEFYTFLKPDIAWYDGKFLSTFPPGLAILASPFYFLGQLLNLSQVFTFLTSVTFTLLTIYLIYQICIDLGLSRRSGVFASTVYAIASVAWPYSVSFSAHSLSAFIITYAAYLLLKAFSNNIKIIEIFLFGILFGMCFLVDYPNILILIPMLIIFSITYFSDIKNIAGRPDITIKFKEFLILLLGFFSIFSIFVIFNLHYFHKPIAFTNTYTIKFLETSGINLEDINLTNEIFKNKNYSGRFSISQTFSGINTLLFSKDRGLLFYSPIFILAIGGIITLYKKNKKWTLTVLISFLLNLLIYASYDDPWGGWAFGPRYLIATMPILAVFAAACFEMLINKYGVIAKILIFILLFFSSAVVLLGASTTNAIPPSIEVFNTNRASNYIANWNYLNEHGVSSFSYNILPRGILSPIAYVLILLSIVFIFELILIFWKTEHPKIGE